MEHGQHDTNTTDALDRQTEARRTDRLTLSTDRQTDRSSPQIQLRTHAYTHLKFKKHHVLRIRHSVTKADTVATEGEQFKDGKACKPTTRTKHPAQIQNMEHGQHDTNSTDALDRHTVRSSTDRQTDALDKQTDRSSPRIQLRTHTYTHLKFNKHHVLYAGRVLYTCRISQAFPSVNCLPSVATVPALVSECLILST